MLDATDFILDNDHDLDRAIPGPGDWSWFPKWGWVKPDWRAYLRRPFLPPRCPPISIIQHHEIRYRLGEERLLAAVNQMSAMAVRVSELVGNMARYEK